MDFSNTDHVRQFSAKSIMVESLLLDEHDVCGAIKMHTLPSSSTLPNSPISICPIIPGSQNPGYCGRPQSTFVLPHIHSQPFREFAFQKYLKLTALSFKWLGVKFAMKKCFH